MSSRKTIMISLIIALASISLFTTVNVSMFDEIYAPADVYCYAYDMNADGEYVSRDGYPNNLPSTFGTYSDTHAFMGWRDNDTGILYPANASVTDNDLLNHTVYAIYEPRPTLADINPYDGKSQWEVTCRSGEVVMFKHYADVGYNFGTGLIKNFWSDSNYNAYYTFYAPNPGVYYIDLVYYGPKPFIDYYGKQVYDGSDQIIITVTSANYEVSFSSEGSIIHTETVEPKSTVPQYIPSAREGYSFDGWCADESLTTPFDFSTQIISDMVLYAKWIENPVTITFMVEGNVHSTLQVPKGSVGVVYTPVMVEGIFAGWYYDDQFQRKYDATVPLDSDINLYALGVPPLVFTSEPNASAVIAQVEYGTFFFDATESSGRYQIHWDFGDGNTSDEPIAYNTYSAPGKYTVTLTITNIYGESNTATYHVVYGDQSADDDGGLRYIVLAAVCMVVGGLVVRRLL